MARERREGNALKPALVVLGGLGLAWLTVETAFKPFLDRLRGTIARSDPACDPDDDDAADRTAHPSAESKASKHDDAD